MPSPGIIDAESAAPVLWHVSEDDPRVVRDENGLYVCACLGSAMALTMVEDRRKYRDLWIAAIAGLRAA